MSPSSRAGAGRATLRCRLGQARSRQRPGKVVGDTGARSCDIAMSRCEIDGMIEAPGGSALQGLTSACANEGKAAFFTAQQRAILEWRVLNGSQQAGWRESWVVLVLGCMLSFLVGMGAVHVFVHGLLKPLWCAGRAEETSLTPLLGHANGAPVTQC